MDWERAITATRTSWRSTRAALATADQRTMLVRVVVGLVAVAGIFVIVGAVMSLFNVWLVVLANVALAVVVVHKSRKAKERERWADQGYCGACGYDLRGSTSLPCPECGRDRRLDEPTWRRMRREFEAKQEAGARTG